MAAHETENSLNHVPPPPKSHRSNDWDLNGPARNALALIALAPIDPVQSGRILIEWAGNGNLAFKSQAPESRERVDLPLVVQQRADLVSEAVLETRGTGTLRSSFSQTSDLRANRLRVIAARATAERQTENRLPKRGTDQLVVPLRAARNLAPEHRLGRPRVSWIVSSAICPSGKIQAPQIQNLHQREGVGLVDELARHQASDRIVIRMPEKPIPAN